MSYVVNACVAPLCHSQNYSGSISVAPSGIPTGRTPEGSVSEFEPLLGSRKATRTRHRRVRGHNHHHLPAGPRATVDQLTLRGADRRIGCLARHRGSGQELHVEVLDRDRLMFVDYPARPHTRSMGVLPGGLLVQSGGGAARDSVPVGRGLSAWATPARHFSLRPSQLSRTPGPETLVGQVEVRVCRSGRGRNTPIDADAIGRRRHLCYFSADHERGIPVSERIPVDTNRTRLRRQFARPHNRNLDALRQSQAAVCDRESIAGVLQRRQTVLAPFDRRPTMAFSGERLMPGADIGTKHLLLGDLGTAAKPGALPTRSGQEFSKFGERGPATAALLVDRLVPQKPAPMPLGLEPAHSLRSGAQAIGVPHGLDHTFECTADISQPGKGSKFVAINGGASTEVRR
ncbi:hypothetical protein ATK86_4536 [Nocardia fluminea]|uniref:Uncharacterized protein n=1 Tax=Nocardia fluminea TaxID=134984 RepID=A0A2N3VER0_9NOCA|nr:hypothetical protein ATK86_4536 [Nocardia fluminea]